jgi:DNA-3-methyladenine glycosylase
MVAGLRRWKVSKRLTRNFFKRSVHEVAPDLIGATLLVNGIGGRLVEVEAYHHTDPASHSFSGPTARNAVMFGPPKGSASAVLIRAIEPTEGLSQMRRRRGVSDERLLCSGPGRLCEALRITGAGTGLALDEPPFELFASKHDAAIVTGPRIGITKAVDKPWRYGEKGSRFLSKPFPERS